ncbi:hypothetical protein MUK42_27473 [Musa troglodytarum]|uniref:Uncharacterized protein n=1 Tax=Musa troglodytarum TaxID=320322 RepID=A0A9E7JR59_9LILI|nr:hypothetical protein MUK42_27473 [Musa troglodytarum]
MMLMEWGRTRPAGSAGNILPSPATAYAPPVYVTVSAASARIAPTSAPAAASPPSPPRPSPPSPPASSPYTADEEATARWDPCRNSSRANRPSGGPDQSHSSFSGPDPRPLPSATWRRCQGREEASGPRYYGHSGGFRRGKNRRTGSCADRSRWRRDARKTQAVGRMGGGGKGGGGTSRTRSRHSGTGNRRRRWCGSGRRGGAGEKNGRFFARCLYRVVRIRCYCCDY